MSEKGLIERQAAETVQRLRNERPRNMLDVLGLHIAAADLIGTLQAENARLAACVEELEGAEKERDEYIEMLGSCGDGNCIVLPQRGQHTNGGCRCWKDPIKMQRFAYAHNRYVRRARAALGKEAG